MRKELISIDELSDSKEYYSSRPNPAIAIFIYCVLALLAAAIAYSFWGKMEIVATATGTILPNEQISSVSSLAGGRVTEVHFRDGQFVQEGDVLFAVDKAELLLSLDFMQKNQAEALFQYEMQDKFIVSLQREENLFSSDVASEEFPYYVQYANYALSLLDSENNIFFEEGKIRENIIAMNRQIADLNRQISGQRLLKDSIESRSNKASQYPEYDNQYRLYEITLEGMKQEYESKRQSIKVDTSEVSAAAALAYYQEQASGYSKLIDSISDKVDRFGASDTSIYHGLYKDYLFQLDQYQAAYDKAQENQSFLRDNRGEDYSSMLQYQRTMLEGYSLYKQSVIDNRDAFAPGSASYAYRHLYTEYQEQFGPVQAMYEQAAHEYERLKAGGGDANAIAAAESAMLSVGALVDEQRQAVLSSIDNQMLQINSTLGEINLNVNTYATDHQLSLSGIEVNTAKEAVSAYKNKMLVQYGENLAQLKSKIQELQYSQDGKVAKETLISDLDSFYLQGLQEKQSSMLAQIDGSLLSLEDQLTKAVANLRLNQLAQDMYNANRANNPAEKDSLVTISYMRFKALGDALTTKEALKNKLLDLDNRIGQMQQQIATATTKASRTGVVNRVQDISVGDVINVGEMIATIVPSGETAYKVQLYVGNKDIAGIEEGATIRYNIMALPSRQYGTVEGAVTYIGTDSLIQNNQRSGYYLVEGTIHADVLTDKDGNQAAISTGMQVEGKIVTQSKRIIRYLLEKINLS